MDFFAHQNYFLKIFFWNINIKLLHYPFFPGLFYFACQPFFKNSFWEYQQFPANALVFGAKSFQFCSDSFATVFQRPVFCFSGTLLSRHTRFRFLWDFQNFPNFPSIPHHRTVCFFLPFWSCQSICFSWCLHWLIHQ